jgi:hypothetical protein
MAEAAWAMLAIGDREVSGAAAAPPGGQGRRCEALTLAGHHACSVLFGQV